MSETASRYLSQAFAQVVAVRGRLAPTMVLGENIARQRKRRKLTQAKLAQAIGATQACICEIERGSREPRVKKLFAIRRALKVSWATLLKGVE